MTEELTTDALFTIAIGGFLAILGLVLIVALALFLWSKLPRPKLKERCETLEWEVESAKRETQQTQTAAQKAAAQAQERFAAELETAREAAAAAQAQANLAEEGRAEVRRYADSLEGKTLAAVKDAGMKEAATAAEAKRLASQLEAAAKLIATDREAAQVATQRLADLQTRHDDLLADHKKLRDCPHDEQTTAYIRETGPDGKRPYSNVGSFCKRCGYVLSNGQAAEHSPPIVVPIAT